MATVELSVRRLDGLRRSLDNALSTYVACCHQVAGLGEDATYWRHEADYADAVRLSMLHAVEAWIDRAAHHHQ